MNIRIIINLISLSVCLLFPSCSAQGPKNTSEKSSIKSSRIRSVPLKQVRITDSFWLPKLETYYYQSIPHSWNYLQKVLTEIEGLAEGNPKEAITMEWDESNLFKHLEAISNGLNQFPDTGLMAKYDSIVDLLSKAQAESGYLYVYGMTRGQEPWVDMLDKHEGFNRGHLYEAAATHSHLHNNNLLEIATKSSDFVYQKFVKEGISGVPNHPGIEMGLAELYRRTGNMKQLELAKHLIERRGTGENGWDCEGKRYPCHYYQDHLPVHRQTRIEGHAVRAIFLITGIADIALEMGDSQYANTANRLWDNLTNRKMAITGGIGVIPKMEALGMEYELPREGYHESCASCGVATCAIRMLRMNPHGSYGDIMEKQFYNNILHGIALDGKSFYYQNYLTGSKQRDNDWVCCPPNLTRTLLGIGKYIYTQTDDEVFVNLYVGNEGKIHLADDVELAIEMSSNYTWEGDVEIVLNPSEASTFSMSLRKPAWAKDYTMYVNDEPIENLYQKNGFLTLNRQWQKGDKIKLSFDMEVTRMQAHPKVYEKAPYLNVYSDKVAIMRGPIVYAVEALDNDGDTQFTIAQNPKLSYRYKEDFLSGIGIINGVTTTGTNFTAIPYFTLANREKSDSEVWLKQEGATSPAEEGWGEILYKPYVP